MGCVLPQFSKEEGKHAHKSLWLLRSHVAVQKPSLREAGRLSWNKYHVLRQELQVPVPGPPVCPPAPSEQIETECSSLPSGTRGPEKWELLRAHQSLD